MNIEFVKYLLAQFPNFAALIAMVVVLIIGFGQVLDRYDQQTQVLYACLASGYVH